MRSFLKVTILILLLVIVAEGSYLGYLLTDTQNIRTNGIPAMEKQGKAIQKELQDYDREASNINRLFPVSKPSNWIQKIEDGLSKAKVTLVNQSTRPAQQIRGTDAQSLSFTLTIRAESMKQLFEAASGVEQIDRTGAARVTRFSISPRRSEESPYTCTIELTIYEQISAFEEMAAVEDDAAPKETTPE